ASQTERVLEALHGLSLLLDLDFARRTVRLHDTVRHFLHHDVGPDSVAAHHRRLVQALDAVGVAPGADAVQRYRLLWLPYHLAEGRERARLEALFLDFAWLQQKLGAIGPAALLADFRLVQDRPAHRRLGDAIRLSSHILAGDPGQF